MATVQALLDKGVSPWITRDGEDAMTRAMAHLNEPMLFALM